ncbi:hypothetical protein G3I40_09975 [Streptomyces sp. SID14478]|uniref:hypothetical protein n=1 Tax=Streptomyces sp. SID14478 TaxID=2706073 RepID=UPI0013DBE4B8|nr:hypothetical protein [Streptomyces sp. SID14478]NEB75550.1 hypothetical protein [Streptomyces sp. SID14478]
MDSARTDRLVNVVDVEATCWAGPQPPGQVSEIPGMAQALEIAGLPLEGRHHRGEDDAWNIAALVLHLAERERWPATAAG